MVAPIRFAAPRAAPGMSECAAIVTRREDREMGKQETARLESSVLRNGSSTVVRRAPTANRDAAGGGIKMPPPAAPDAPVQRPDYSETDWDALRAAYPRDAERVKRAMFIVSAATEN